MDDNDPKHLRDTDRQWAAGLIGPWVACVVAHLRLLKVGEVDLPAPVLGVDPLVVVGSMPGATERQAGCERRVDDKGLRVRAEKASAGVCRRDGEGEILLDFRRILSEKS